jgi:protein SCO1/2
MLRIKWFGALAPALLVWACSPAPSANGTDIQGVMPRLEFSLVRANDGASIDAESYRGKTVLLYFGYTHCPDECPTTLTDLSDMLRHMGSRAKDTRVLFVSVDPARDTIPVMRNYVRAFGPGIDGLRGNANAIAALARRYRVLYQATSGKAGQPYEVMHSDSVFVFDREGHARVVLTSTKDSDRLATEMKALASS